MFAFFSNAKSFALFFQDKQLETFSVETPRHPEHGDFAITLAFSLAKHLKKAPKTIADTLIQTLENNTLSSNGFTYNNLNL